LDAAALEALVARAVGSTPAPELVERLHELTEGNPFFIDEILRGTDASGLRLTLPDSLRDAIHRRLDPLSDDERALLATASVIGREFDAGVLGAATGIDPGTVLGRLTPAVAIGVVEEHERVGCFRFTHAIVREMLYGELLPAARVESHHRVALALEAVHGDGDDAPLDAQAFHYFHAAPLGGAAKAFDFSMRAARRAS